MDIRSTYFICNRHLQKKYILIKFFVFVHIYEHLNHCASLDLFLEQGFKAGAGVGAAGSGLLCWSRSQNQNLQKVGTGTGAGIGERFEPELEPE